MYRVGIMLSLSGLSPAEGEKLVSPESEIEFTIVDDGSGIDISTLIVEVKGFRAIDGSDFQSGFNGLDSIINPSGDDFIVVIDPEDSFALGSIISVKIQVQTLDGAFFNQTNVFKILPKEPILINSDPIDGDILTSPQKLLLEFEDIVDGIDLATINIEINDLSFIVDGAVVAAENGPLTDISETDGVVSIRIDPIEPLRNEIYILSYSVSDTSGNLLSSQLTFEVDAPESVLPKVFPQADFLGFNQGIDKVSDIGVGDTLLIEWNKPIGRSYQNEIFILVYQNENRLQLFDEPPTFLATTDIQKAYINNLIPSKTLSYGVRVVEFSIDTFVPTGMTEESTNFYRVPQPATLTETVDTTQLVIRVNSASGFPDEGYLLIGQEVIRYNSVSRETNAFSIVPNGRGLLNSTASVYLSGDEVSLFLACTDKNSVIIAGTPTYQDGYRSGRELEYEGFVVPDYSDNDKNFFQGFDFCGYHDSLPWQTLQGKNDCGSYLGGEFNGFRGFNLYDRMLNQEEVLLEQTGEPVVLLKRLWNGEICSCSDPRRMGTKQRSCVSCYGTGFEGGYQQYLNLRRGDKRLMMHFNETNEDLSLGESSHLHQEFEPNAWTLPAPAIRDRDLIVRFDFTDDIEYIYEVLNSSREKLLFRKFGKQTLALKRLDKTELAYTFKYTLF